MTKFQEKAAKYQQQFSQAEEAANVSNDDEQTKRDVAQEQAALKRNLEAEMKELQNRLDETVVRNSRIMEDIEAAEANLTNFLETQTQKKDEIEKKRKKLEQYQQTVAMHQEKCDKLFAERDTTLEAARKLHHRLTLRKQPREMRQAVRRKTYNLGDSAQAAPSLDFVQESGRGERGGEFPGRS
jgi:chromosome segregation ATPase